MKNQVIFSEPSKRSKTTQENIENPEKIIIAKKQIVLPRKKKITFSSGDLTAISENNLRINQSVPAVPPDSQTRMKKNENPTSVDPNEGDRTIKDDSSYSSGVVYNQDAVVINVSQMARKHVEGKHFPCLLAYAVLFINLIIPGVGTMIATLAMTDPLLKASFCCSGCFELCMAFLLVGWVFAFLHSCLFIGAAHSSDTFEDYHSYMNKRNNCK